MVFSISPKRKISSISQINEEIYHADQREIHQSVFMLMIKRALIGLQFNSFNPYLGNDVTDVIEI
jgi:hypothetical protein